MFQLCELCRICLQSEFAVFRRGRCVTPGAKVAVIVSLHLLIAAIYGTQGRWSKRWGREYGSRSGNDEALASFGYLIYLFSPSWPFVFLGLAFVMAWSSMASPAIFAIIGDALPKEQRAMGFTIQSFLKRIPMAVAPCCG
jgi:hypothetical protein